MINVGIVGAGVIGKRLSKAFDEVDGIKIRAICDLDIDKARFLAKDYEAEVETDFNKLIKREDIDLIYVGVPPKFHYPIVIAAIRNGKHLLCEKPIAENAIVGKKILDEAANSDLITALNLPFRYTSCVKSIKNMLDNGELGDIKRIELKFRFPTWPREWQNVDWLNYKDQGGALREVGSHFYFAILELFGKIKRVLAFVNYPNTEFAETDAVGIIELDSGLLCTLDLINNIESEEENSLIIFGSSKSIALIKWYQLIDINDNRVICDKYENSSIQVVENMIKAINNEEHDLVSLKMGVETQKILDAIYNSNGKWINID